jgi:hypothetical protein
LGAAPDAWRGRRAETSVVSQTDSRTCTLRLIVAAKAEPCPGELCAFWEPGGAVVAGGCVIDRLGVDVRRRDLASYLLDTRERLERARDSIEGKAA